MLKPIQSRKTARGNHRIAIVASRYNETYVNGMADEAVRVLKQNGARLQIVRVPGAFEIPVAAARLAARPKNRPSAIICLGVILRGETSHAQHIGEAVSQALVRIQIEHGIPVIHEVLLLENERQARVRCLGKKHNRGAEAAYTALEMAEVIKKL